MAIKRNEFLEALRRVVSAEFEQIPKKEEEIDYTFSPRFMKRMLRLFRNRKKLCWRFVNTGAKRVAVIFIAAALVFATACSFKPIREPIMRFITEIYETFTAYFFEGETVDAIEKEYTLEEPPEGFTQTNRINQDKKMITTTYENGKGDVITITQSLAQETQLLLDCEKEDAKAETIDGVEVIIYDFETIRQVIWIKDHYLFQVISTGNVDLEILKELVTKLK